MSDYSTKGTLKTILPIETGVAKSTGKEWKKVSFVVTNNDGYEGREQMYAFEIFGDEKVDNFIKYNQEGSEVEVKFNIQTNEWNGKYYTSLSAYRVDSGEKVEQATYTPNINGTPKPAPVPVDDVDDDLPF